ncbi:hypothetical protein BDZ97DRAFT_1757877 [Flammula alnicola]|nr:hypothetical protein BDZ97DRAFT_1757877 [Flammula alnicola]
MDATPEREPEPSTLHVPDGFAALVTPDGDRYIVPKFMIPATQQAFGAYRKQVELDVVNENGCVHWPLLDPTDSRNNASVTAGADVGAIHPVSVPVPVIFPLPGPGALPVADCLRIPKAFLAYFWGTRQLYSPLTRELLASHAEVKALQEQLGLSYKDASHRLYMSTWEKVKADEETKKFFAILSERTKNSLEIFQTRLLDIARTNGHPVSEDTASAEVLPDI